MRSIVCAAAIALLASASAMAGSPQVVVLDVQNMTCPLCPITVRQSLKRVPGVADAKVDLERKTATVKFDPDQVRIATLRKATADAGFPSTVRE